MKESWIHKKMKEQQKLITAERAIKSRIIKWFALIFFLSCLSGLSYCTILHLNNTTLGSPRPLV